MTFFPPLRKVEALLRNEKKKHNGEKRRELACFFAFLQLVDDVLDENVGGFGIFDVRPALEAASVGAQTAPAEGVAAVDGDGRFQDVPAERAGEEAAVERPPLAQLAELLEALAAPGGARPTPEHLLRAGSGRDRGVERRQKVGVLFEDVVDGRRLLRHDARGGALFRGRRLLRRTWTCRATEQKPLDRFLRLACATDTIIARSSIVFLFFRVIASGRGWGRRK